MSNAEKVMTYCSLPNLGGGKRKKNHHDTCGQSSKVVTNEDKIHKKKKKIIRANIKTNSHDSHMTVLSLPLRRWWIHRCWWGMLAGILIGRSLLSRKLTDQNCDSNLELWSDSCLYEPTPVWGGGCMGERLSNTAKQHAQHWHTIIYAGFNLTTCTLPDLKYFGGCKLWIKTVNIGPLENSRNTVLSAI